MNKLLGASLCLCLMACGSKGQKEEAVELTVQGDTVLLSIQSPINGKIQTIKTNFETYTSDFQTTGTVRAIAGQIAEIAAPFDGRIVRSNIRLGQKVGKGTPLFELNSSDFHETAKTYFQAKQNNELAQKNYARKKDLMDGGVASKRDLEEALAEAENAHAELEQATASMRILNVNPESVAIGQPLSVVSPISGEVVKCDITIGQFVKSDDETLATVADLSKVWVSALLKEKYFGIIQKGDKAKIFIDARPDNPIFGNIYHIGELLDEETRSAEVLIECDNATRDLKPGMFTEVHFLSEKANAILIPSTALFQAGENSYVFVAESNGTYVRRNVTSESADGNKVRILSGLSNGETIVSNGGIFLIR